MTPGRLSYRVFGCFAIINALLIVVPIFLAPLPPLGPGADLVTFNSVHRGTLIVGNYLGVIQLPVSLFLLLFIAAATRQAEKPSGGWLWLLVTGSAVSASTFGAVLATYFLLGPFMVNLGQPALELLSQFGLYSLSVSYSIQALLLGAIGVAVLRLRYVPVWLGYLVWLAAILSGLATLGLIFTSGPLSATSPVSLFIGGLSLPIWLLVLGIYWIFQPGSAPRSADT
jgi:hypothetical protein